MRYEVTLTAVCVVAIEAGSEGEALDIAMKEASMDEYEFHEAEAKQITDDALWKATVRHADLHIPEA